MTLVLMIVGIVVISVILWKVFSKESIQENDITETGNEEPIVMEQPSPEVETEQPESPDEVEKRLKEMKNPDEGKPFAKISTPDVSEIPAEEPAKPKKKKRYYKKRAPKKPGTDNAAI
jgi:outer membrane biosynthesis protein TonB